VRQIDAGVEDGDPDVGSHGRELAAQLGGVDQLRAARVGRVVDALLLDRAHPGERGEGDQPLGRHLAEHHRQVG
jgi:hypothetical protein